MSDQPSFEAFMEAYQNMVYSVAARLLGNETDALDVAQEVFIKAHARFEDLQDNPAAGGWLKTVATNLSLNHLNRYRARWRFFSEMLNDESGEDFAARLSGPERQEDQEEEEFRRFHLEKVLQRLPAAQRVPLVLYHFEELSYEEIASRLNISLSKVKTDIHRARQSLRRWLQPGWDATDGDRRRESDPDQDGLGMARSLWQGARWLPT